MMSYPTLDTEKYKHKHTARRPYQQERKKEKYRENKTEMKRFAVLFGFAAVTLQEWTVSVLQTGGREEKCVHHVTTSHQFSTHKCNNRSKYRYLGGGGSLE